MGREYTRLTQCWKNFGTILTTADTANTRECVQLLTNMKVAWVHFLVVMKSLGLPAGVPLFQSANKYYQQWLKMEKLYLRTFFGFFCLKRFQPRSKLVVYQKDCLPVQVFQVHCYPCYVIALLFPQFMRRISRCAISLFSFSLSYNS